MAKSHAAYERKKAAQAAYQPRATSLRSITLRECLGKSERKTRSRQMTRADHLSQLAHNAGCDDIAMLIDRR